MALCVSLSCGIHGAITRMRRPAAPAEAFVALFPTPQQMQSLIADADDQPVVRSPAIGKQSVAIAAT